VARGRFTSESDGVKTRSQDEHVRSEVITAVTMKNAVVWDVVPCVNRRFGGTYRPHLQGILIREQGTSVSRWLKTVNRRFGGMYRLHLQGIQIRERITSVRRWL
jgi:hypothetical protein